MATAPDIRVVNNAPVSQYEVWVDDQLAGFSSYEERPGVVVFLHTEVQSGFEGHGVGSQLAAGALDDVRARGLSVWPRCPFIAAYIESHPSYRDLVVSQA